MGVQECPSCRRHVATRRSLRPDRSFTQLITRIIPDIEDFEEEQMRAIEESTLAEQLPTRQAQETRIREHAAELLKAQREADSKQRLADMQARTVLARKAHQQDERKQRRPQSQAQARLGLDPSAEPSSDVFAIGSQFQEHSASLTDFDGRLERRGVRSGYRGGRVQGGRGRGRSAKRVRRRAWRGNPSPPLPRDA